MRTFSKLLFFYTKTSYVHIIRNFHHRIYNRVSQSMKIKLSFAIITLVVLALISFNQTIRMMSQKVFVYGTLKRNEPNHHWLTDTKNGYSKFLNEGYTKIKYPLIIATKYNIPFLLHKPGDGHQVKGEIYEVDDQMLSNLDILEDHPNYYIREIDDILVSKGETTETVKAWVYFLKKFRTDLLSRDKMDNYSSKGPHGLVYMESNNESTIEDLDDIIRK